MYKKHINKAIKKLNLAVTYAEDGAPMEAMRCAAETIGLLAQASVEQHNLYKSGA